MREPRAGPRGFVAEYGEPKERKLVGEGSQEWEPLGGTREEAKRAEGTRRRPLRVQRGTRAGGEILCKEERGERGGCREALKGKKEKDREKEIGLELTQLRTHTHN